MFQISELSSIALFVRVGVDLAVRRLDARLPLSALPGLARRVLASCAAHSVPTAIRIVCPVAEAHSRRQTIAEYAPHTGTDTPLADHVASRGTAWNSALSDIVQSLNCPFPQSIHVRETAPRHSRFAVDQSVRKISAFGPRRRAAHPLVGARRRRQVRDRRELQTRTDLVPDLADLVPDLADLVP